MDDRELLELAAKAASMDVATWSANVANWKWNPLRDDGDALRMAVMLGLVVDCSRPSAGEPFGQHSVWLDELADTGTLTRRAIVLAAAEIGKALGA